MKKIALFLAEGFEEIEALTVVDVLRRSGETCDIISIGEKSVLGAHNILVNADKIIGDYTNEYDAIVFPGGMKGARNLQKDKRIIDIVKAFNDKDKLICAICAAPIILKEADIIKNRKITSYPGFENELEGSIYEGKELVVIDGNIITSRGPATALEFSYEILKKLNNDKYEDLKEGMMYNFLISGDCL